MLKNAASDNRPHRTMAPFVLFTSGCSALATQKLPTGYSIRSPGAFGKLYGSKWMFVEELGRLLGSGALSGPHIQLTGDKMAVFVCQPSVRIAFHAVLVLAGIGGFRPGMFNRIRYREVDIELVLDPDSGETRLVAQFTLHQNKQKAFSLKKDQAHMYVARLVSHLFLFCKWSRTPRDH